MFSRSAVHQTSEKEMSAETNPEKLADAMISEVTEALTLSAKMLKDEMTEDETEMGEILQATLKDSIAKLHTPEARAETIKKAEESPARFALELTILRLKTLDAKEKMKQFGRDYDTPA